MRFDKKKAFELRKEGKSYKEIRSILGMSLATLSDWFKGEKWSQEIKHTLASDASAKNKEKLVHMQEARREKLKLSYEKARIEAEKEYKEKHHNPLFIAGLMIYWGEGDKLSKYKVGIANTEPRMIRVFSRFLQEVCGIAQDKMRCWILLYPDLDADKCRAFWVEQSGLRDSNFSKNVLIKGKSSIRRLHYGVCNIAFHNRYFKEKMLIWLKLAAEELSDNKNAGMV